MMWNFDDWPNNVAVITESCEEITYKQLGIDGKRWAEAVGRRCLVFCLCENSYPSLVGHTAAINAGMVPLLLDKSIDVQVLENLISIYRPNYLWLPDNHSGNTGKSLFELGDYALVATGFDDTPQMHEDLALLLTTSGSTGSPKLVRQSYKNILSNTKSIAEYLGIDSAERAITTLPMSYTYGLSIINTHLYTGAALIMTNARIVEKGFWQLFKRGKASSFGGVPYTYEMLERLRFFNMDLPSLRTMTQAGGKLSPELHRKFADYAMKSGRRFFVMYGQTEATARMSYLPCEKALEKHGSMGIAIPGGAFRLVDDAGVEISGPDAVGELVYYGDNVTMGYAEKAEDLALSDENNGILFTGDMAKRDGDGFYYIVGRKKRFLKLLGNRVNLDEIEQIIKSEYPEGDFACAGADNLMAIYTTNKNLKSEIIVFLSKRLKLHHSLFVVNQVDEIPKNEAGKILYSKLESL